MIAALMYHRVGVGKHTNPLPLLRDHLIAIKEKYPIILPGAPLKDRLSVVLSFDDATYDFYYYLFPLLKELKIQAVLGVPTSYIVEKSSLSPEVRLSVSYSMMMQEEIAQKKVPFCTWEEIQEMVASGHVAIASHSHTHPNLTFPFVDLKRELALSKQILEEKVPQCISSFIYPFGKTDFRVEKYASTLYPYRFRIGSALNFGWGKGKTPLKRIPADHLKAPEEPLTSLNLVKFGLKALLNGF